MSIIACYSSKGGVGKTSAAINLAHASSQAGNHTLLVDLDQQGASSFYCRVRPPKRHRAKKILSDREALSDAIRETDHSGLHLLPAHQSYRNFDALLDGMKRSNRQLAKVIDQIASEYDHLILDCPPSLSHVAENVFRAADTILVPLVPTTLSLRTYEQLKAFFEKSGYKRKKIHPFFSMVDQRKRLHRDIMQALRESEKRILDTEIPYSAQIEAMGLHREPVACFAPKHKSSLAFQRLWQEIDPS
ncbi:AAA family ATPase [Pelagicoccus sp. SDUM812003]|uniref:ParA family protein n=1 Tax=Pelagicoccus sp. SDUM812003 TaxID=3041267 RepID=UPI00281056C2|nr:AAA family ATPase [Pelagicoccus sp. SDUM812003]MDQ8203813.1 AAA family ATPase [Pelagicoccus sp. SDUM812003]